MTDRELVLALRAGDRLAAGQAYDIYGTRLYAYCHELLGNHKLAGDALRDTFIIAVNRVRELRRPDDLGAWLYALARNECERIGISEDIPADAGEAARGDRLARFALDCYAMLPPGTRELLDLAFRHRLVDADLSRVLGMTEEEVSDAVSAAQADLENTLLVVLASRTGDPKCAEGADLGRKFDHLDGKGVDSWLQTVSRHIDRCGICGAAIKTRRPLRLYEELPHSFMPPGVRSRVLESLRDPAGAAFAERVSERAGKFDEDGFPVAGGRSGSKRKWLVPVGMIAGIGVVVVAAYSIFLGGHSPSNTGNAAAASSSSLASTVSATATAGTSGLTLPSSNATTASAPTSSSAPATSAAGTVAMATVCVTTTHTTLVPSSSPSVSLSPSASQSTTVSGTPPVTTTATVTVSVPVTYTVTTTATKTSTSKSCN